MASLIKNKIFFVKKDPDRECEYMILGRKTLSNFTDTSLSAVKDNISAASLTM
jgi:hypothetical protein